MARNSGNEIAAERSSSPVYVICTSHRSTGIKKFLIGWCICLFFMELFGAGFARNGVYTTYDFRAFYAAGHLVRTHPSHLYDLELQKQTQYSLISQSEFVPFYHPSYEALIFAPFSFLQFRSSYLAFIAFNMVLLGLSFFAARPALSSTTPHWQRWVELTFLFIPVWLAMAFGQDSILTLLLYCLSWRCLEDQKDFSAGCLLGLAIFKFHLVIPIALLLGVRLGRRFLAGFFATSVGIVLACIGIVGFRGAVDYIHVLSGAASAMDKGLLAQQSLSVYPFAMPNIAGLLYVCGARWLSTPALFGLLIGICSLGVFVWCARVMRRCNQDIAFAIAILCGLLVSYHLYMDDLTLLLIPAALLAGRVPRFIFIAMFGLPIVLLAVGWHWFFLMGLPVLVILVFAIRCPPRELRHGY